MASSYTILSSVCMDNGNLAWQDSCVHGVIGTDIPCLEESVATQMQNNVL